MVQDGDLEFERVTDGMQEVNVLFPKLFDSELLPHKLERRSLVQPVVRTKSTVSTLVA